MLFDYCRAQADTAAGDAAPMDLSMLGKGGKGKKGKGDKKGEGKGKGKKGESSEDEKDKDKKGKGKGKNNVNTEYFAGYCHQCKGWGHVQKDCWWNENAKNAKDTASLETPTTPAESTKTEPPVTGMLIPSDEGGEIPARPTRWMYSVTKQEPVLNANDFLIDSGASTPVCQQSLADSLGGKPRGPGVELRSATGHQFTTTGNTTTCLRTRDGVNVASDSQIAPKNTGLQRSIISVGQVCDRGHISTFRSTGGTILDEFTGNRIEFERAGGVYRLIAGTSARMQTGPGEVKVLMGFEQDAAGDAEAQPA